MKTKIWLAWQKRFKFKCEFTIGCQISPYVGSFQVGNSKKMASSSPSWIIYVLLYFLALVSLKHKLWRLVLWKMLFRHKSTSFTNTRYANVKTSAKSLILSKSSTMDKKPIENATFYALISKAFELHPKLFWNGNCSFFWVGWNLKFTDGANSISTIPGLAQFENGTRYPKFPI